MLLEEDDINELKFTVGGKKLLKKLISSCTDITPSDTVTVTPSMIETSTRIQRGTVPHVHVIIIIIIMLIIILLLLLKYICIYIISMS